MWRILLLTSVLAGLAGAQDFRFSIASPVAAQDYRVKTASFVFRTEGCADPAKAQISGTAEGLVNGERRSVPLKVQASSKPGVYAVFQTWPPEGQWLVNLKGTCGNLAAGALVPAGPKGFNREGSKLLPHPATDAEIEQSLRALSTGGDK